VRPGYDWAAKYKVMPDSVEADHVSQNFLPKGHTHAAQQVDIIQDMERAVTENKCEFVDFASVPFELKKRSKTCQVCSYEMRKPKWKGVVMCMNHGVRLCSTVSPPRCNSLPKLYQTNGELVSDFSWTCPKRASSWNKFHDFYLEKGLFSRKQILVSDGMMKFGSALYSSTLYQR
jgi:hypothetical protein